MGKLNEVQEQTTQSYGSNSFTTRIKENTVEFDSAKDKFTFLDPVEAPSISIGGTSSVPFTSEDRTKLDNLQTPMQIKGRVDSVGDLPTEGVTVGDTYLVGLSGSETFEEYVCVELSGSPEAPVWESVGTTQVQSDWNQNNATAPDFIKNKICYDTRVSVSYLETTFSEYASISSTFDALRPMTAGSYKIVIGDSEEIVDLQLNQAGENLSGGFTLAQGSGSVNYYSQNETIQINCSGNPALYGNKSFNIVNFEGELVTIDNKYLGFYITSGSGSGSIIESSSSNIASGNYSHAEGSGNTASGKNSHSEGGSNTSSGEYAHTEGSNNIASGSQSHSEGNSSKASGNQSHSEGSSTTASGHYSHSEGSSTTASGSYSHSEGRMTTASGDCSHSEGRSTTASGDYSHSSGYQTAANHKSQFTFGEYNILDPSAAAATARGTYVEIVGNGTGSSARSNARTLDWDGNEMLSGTLTIGGTSGATIKVESGALKVSFDGGTTWLTISAS